MILLNSWNRRRVTFVAGMRAFLTSAAIQGASYLILTLNFRAIAHAHVWEAMITDALAAAFSFIVVRRVLLTEHPRAVLAGMMLGGALAANVGITLTRAWG